MKRITNYLNTQFAWKAFLAMGTLIVTFFCAINLLFAAPIDFFDITYEPVVFSKANITGSEVFFANIKSKAVVAEDLPKPIAALRYTYRYFAENNETGEEQVLNPNYLGKKIEPFPMKEGESYETSDRVLLKFPDESKAGEYTVYEQVIYTDITKPTPPSQPTQPSAPTKPSAPSAPDGGDGSGSGQPPQPPEPDQPSEPDQPPQPPEPMDGFDPSEPLEPRELGIINFTPVKITTITVTSIALSPDSVTGGSSLDGTVTISSPAPARGKLVRLSATPRNLVSMPMGVRIKAGETTGTFKISTKKVDKKAEMKIKASILKSNQTATLTINPGTEPSLTGIDAAYVIGQKDFTSKLVATTQSGLGSGAKTNRNGRGRQSSVAYDTKNQRLFVVDTGNNRVLVFDLSMGISNGMNASYVFGQKDFISNVGATTQSGMRFPYGAFMDTNNQRLYVNDSKNNRVLVFELFNGIRNGMNASYVLGQPDFTSSTVGMNQSGMWDPYGGFYDDTNKRLFVNDTGNSRVLVFDIAGGIKNGMSAIYVLGQKTFKTNTQTTGQSGMYFPFSSYYEAINKWLFVDTSATNRVLVFDLSKGIQNGMNAAYVLGQPDFQSTTYGATKTKMWSPDGLAFDTDNKRLFISDSGANRILIYDISKGIQNGMKAVGVIGQKDFNSHVSATTQSGMDAPEGVAYDQVNKRLFVADNNNSRVLVYDLGLPPPPDKNTVLFDEFNGSTIGKGYGTITYEDNLPDSGKAVNMVKGSYIKYKFDPWYKWDGTHSWNRNEASSGTVTEGKIEMMIKPRQYNGILTFNWSDAGPTPSAGYVMHLGFNSDGKLQYSVWGGHLDTVLIGNTKVPLNTWSKIVVSWGPNGTKLILNDQTDATTDANLWPAFKGTTFAYLNYWGANDLGFIDNFRLSKRAGE